MARCAPLLSASALLLPLLAGLCAGGTPDTEEVKPDLFRKDLKKKVEMKLYTRNNLDNGELLNVDNAERLRNSTSFNPLVPTKLIVHGWLSGEEGERGGVLLKDALLEAGDYNVILVDWSQADSINYLGSRYQVKALGQLVGQLVIGLRREAGLKYSGLHLIGHSLGAHVMGFAGRTAGLAPQGRITALDPAGPLFWDSPESRLDKTDAGFVDVIHTCGGYLGYSDPIGHADFYPNGGTWVQPGCGIDLGACSHCRSYSLLLESIESPNALVGTACSSWKKWKGGKCEDSDTAELGLGCSTEARGSFFLRTNKVPPYSRTSGKPASERLKASKNFQNC